MWLLHKFILIEDVFVRACMLHRLLKLLLLLLRNHSLVLIVDILPRQQFIPTFVVLIKFLILVQQLVLFHQVGHLTVVIQYVCLLRATVDRTSPADHERLGIFPAPKDARYAPRSEPECCCNALCKDHLASGEQRL